MTPGPGPTSTTSTKPTPASASHTTPRRTRLTPCTRRHPPHNHHHQHQQHDRLISAADVPQDVAPTVAEYVRSYSQLEALIDAHPTQFTAAVLLPILTRLLPVVVEAMFGVLVEVPIPQLALEVAALVPSPHRSALPLLAMRLLGVLLPIVGLGSFLVWIIPRLPLPQSLSHGCRMAVAIEQLSRRLRMLERGGDWARWRPHLEMLYHIRGKRPVVLGDGHFEVFGSQTGRGFIGETEAVRQWRILSGAITVHHRGQQRQLMDGDWILHTASGYRLPALLTSASPLFPHVPFDPADPPTERDGLTYRSYTSIMAFVLFCWLRCGGHLPCIRSWISWRRDSAASRRVRELLAASPSDAAQWGAGAAVFDRKPRWSEGHERLVVLGSEAMGEGHMAVIRLVRDSGRTSDRSVEIFTTESAPHDKTRTAVMRMLGDHLGGKVWRGEWER
mmetsp:Transcript_42633/g.120930  ORF Transcript_42633/g.120930 Transcript_42633/m.120930 type:complete len:446 (-) Transcript_42633:1242-2579(-)